MKLPVPLLLCTAILGLSPLLRAESSPVSIEVKQESKTETSKDKLTKTQRRTLKVSLVNSTKAEVTAKVKYAFFGHGMKEHDLTMLDSGDRDATLKPSGTETVETPPTSIAYSDEHYDAKAKKKIDATGNKVVGWGVQVFVGEKMVAEAYEPLSMKDQMGKAPAAKKEEAKK